MACYISAGHHLKDPGAIGVHQQKEATLTMQFRDLVVPILKAKGVKVITDNDNETLAQYLTRIQPGSASVVCEYHFDAFNGKASGCTVLIADGADKNCIDYATELAHTTANILGIPNRGVKKQSESARGKLGLMREKGIVALVELCFIDNESDMQKFHASKVALASAHAVIHDKYDALIP